MSGGDGQKWFLHSIADYKDSLEASLGLWSDRSKEGGSISSLFLSPQGRDVQAEVCGWLSSASGIII